MSKKPYEYADDPIPINAIRLSEAYQLVLRALSANRQILKTLSRDILRDLRASDNSDPSIVPNWSGFSEDDKTEYRREKEATVFFVDRLRKGELLTYIRDPDTGDTLQLNPRDWQPTIRGLVEPVRIPAGLPDHLPYEYDTPEIAIRGAYRPVFLWKEEFQRWLKVIFGNKAHPGGRPKGAGSFQVADKPLVLKMHNLIKSGHAKSANDAARQLAPKARGGGTVDAKQARLRKSYLKMFPLKRN